LCEGLREGSCRRYVGCNAATVPAMWRLGWIVLQSGLLEVNGFWLKWVDLKNFWVWIVDGGVHGDSRILMFECFEMAK
jgi:hypothetical protein